MQRMQLVDRDREVIMRMITYSLAVVYLRATVNEGFIWGKFMKDKTKSIVEKIRKNNGMVIVEAAIVFPIMFFVLFFIIFIGNMYFEQAKVDDITLRYATKGAEYVSDPFQYDMERTHAVPTDVNALDIEPYRYILGSITNGSISDVEDRISQEVKDEINDNSLIFFSNSRANIVGSDNSKIATFKNYVIYSTFIVQVNYEIKFPIRFLGNESPTIIKLSSRSEVPVSDSPEFIRNVDMVVDLLDGTSTGDTIKGIFEKINNFIKQFN